MEQFIATILTLLLSLPSYYTDKETTEERTERMTVIATAIANASSAGTCSDLHDTEDCEPIWKGSKEQLAVALITVGFWESRFAKHIHENKCRPGYEKSPGHWVRGECDEVIIRNPKTGKITRRYFASRTVFQMQYDSGIKSEWGHMSGTGLQPTSHAAWAATKKLSRCYPTTPKKMFMCYAGTKNPNWSGAKPRADFFEAKLHKTFVSNDRVASNP